MGADLTNRKEIKMFIEVMELTSTDDGKGITERPILINTSNIIRVEALGNDEGDYDANIVMNDGAEVLVEDYRYDSLVDLICGRIDSYTTYTSKNSKTRNNQKIRNAMKEKNLSQYEVARLLNYREDMFSKMLRYELPEDEQNELIEKINALKVST